MRWYRNNEVYSFDQPMRKQYTFMVSMESNAKMQIAIQLSSGYGLDAGAWRMQGADPTANDKYGGLSRGGKNSRMREGTDALYGRYARTVSGLE